MLKKLFITIIFASLVFAQVLSGNCTASEAQCLGRDFPMIDEGSKDASFTSFRDELLKAVRERNAGYIKSIADPNIILSYADEKSGKPSISGIVNFSDMHKPQEPNSPFWKTLEIILSMGGGFKNQNREIFEAPYVHSEWPEGCGITWYEAKKFIEKLNEMSDGTYRLPTEAEWEYACRSAGKAEKYSGGNNENLVAWTKNDERSGRLNRPVGVRAPNGLGIYDMSGNLWEWCEDKYTEKAYDKHERKNPVNDTANEKRRVYRGGSWRDFPQYARCGYRSGNYPDAYGRSIGFRLVRNP